jgi:hypothetical protein
MLNLDKLQQIEGLSVYGDDSQANLFYVLADQPRFRIDDVTKKPVFKFIKYKMPVGRPDGSKGGGFVIFDSNFVVPDDKMNKIQSVIDSQLQNSGWKDASGQPLKAQIGRITFTSGTASLTLLDSGGALVSKIESVGKPSLYGSLLCSFTAELTPEGATVVEAAMKGSGGVAQIAYDLHCSATLPPITGRVWFYASKFYSFYQSVDKSGGSWDSSDNTEVDKMRESFTSSQAGGVYFDFSHLDLSNPDAAKQTKEAITNWGWSQIDQAVKTAVLPDIKAAEDRGDHGMEHIQKMQSTWESSSFDRSIAEKEAIDFHLIPQGTLPNITDMGFKWQDFFLEVDANDPFFAQINATVAVNADFDRFGIDSVDVHLEYTKTSPATIKDFHLKKPDDVGAFASDTANGDMNYAYSFSVNYKDQGQAYQSALTTTDKGHITINANDLGILYVGISVGSVDFIKTPQVQVAIRYPDADANGQPVNQQFTFDKDKKSDHMVAVILKPITKAYQYQITYIMADGTQVGTDWTDHQASELYINSPFVLATFSFLAEGDFANNFANSIDNIFLKMKYTDAANKIEQESDFLFTAANRSHDWQIPVIRQGKGQITYAGVVSYKNHTTENIPDTSSTSSLITFGPPNQAVVTVTPDPALIDFTKVKLIKLDFEYADKTNNIDIHQEIVVKQQGASPPSWTFYAKDPNKTSYSYGATFYMATDPPSVVKQAPATSSDGDLILMMPS